MDRPKGAMAAALALLWVVGGCAPSAKTADELTVRVGHFPNVTHGPALVGQAVGWFEPRVGKRVVWQPFNAGPAAMEALLVGAIDLSYVGPNPATNAYLRSKGEALRIVAGVASGGAALVVRQGSGIQVALDFRGKRVASPELGNTQDVALRHWLIAQGLVPNQSVSVLAVKNPDILTLFQRHELDAAWVPEPWVTRLVQEADGAIFLDERNLWPEQKFTTAVLVVRAAFLRDHPDLVRKFVAAHVELIDWIQRHPEEARIALNDTLARLAGKPLPPQVLTEALSRLDFTADPIPAALLQAASWAQALGYLPQELMETMDLQAMFDLSFLNEALQERGQAPMALSHNQQEKP